MIADTKVALRVSFEDFLERARARQRGRRLHEPMSGAIRAARPIM
jgi:hypothetical protein